MQRQITGCEFTFFHVNITTSMYGQNLRNYLILYIKNCKQFIQCCISDRWRHRNSRAARIYLHTKFGEPTSPGGRVMAIYVFSKWSRPPSWIFPEVKCGDISVSGTWDVSGLNFVRISAIATELWPFEWICQNSGRRHLGFLGSEMWHHRKSRAARIYLHTKFCEATSTGGRIVTIYVFSKWQSAAILDFCGSKIWRYFCFRDVGFSLW